MSALMQHTWLRRSAAVLVTVLGLSGLSAASNPAEAFWVGVNVPYPVVYPAPAYYPYYYRPHYYRAYYYRPYWRHYWRPVHYRHWGWRHSHWCAWHPYRCYW